MKGQSFIRRLGWAAKGIVATAKLESSFRVQLIFSLGATALLVWIRPEPVWWALVGLTTGGVLAAELINTAIEALADHLHPKEHFMIARAKDCAAGAVLVMSIAALLVAGALIWNYWHNLL